MFFAILILTTFFQILSGEAFSEGFNDYFYQSKNFDNLNLKLFENINDDYQRLILNSSYQNGVLNNHQKFEDDKHFYLSYSIKQVIKPNLELMFSYYIENTKEKPLINNQEYWNDSFLGFSGDLQQGFLKFSFNNIFLKFGRDFFSPGYLTKNRILFSSDGDPYDHYIFSYEYNNLIISSYYLYLSPYPKAANEERHLNGHSLNYRFKNGYISLNEVILYGGDNVSMNFSLINPLNLYYVYHRNHSNFKSNSIISSEILYTNNSYDIFVEFVLDDFQIEKKRPSDLEPSEYGILIALKKKFQNHSKIGFSFLKISNRTFNAPLFNYEKFINKNFPISHILGNNFWTYSFNYGTKIKDFHLFFVINFLEKGEDALYSDFNTDYLNYSIDQGYDEDFPFGKLNSYKSVSMEFMYNYKNILYFSNLLTYFDDSNNELPKLNYSISLTFDFLKVKKQNNKDFK